MAIKYVRVDGNNANPGTANDAANAWLTLAYANSQVGPGDEVRIVPNAGNAASRPTSGLDYTIVSTYILMTHGTVGGGVVRWRGYGGIPTIGFPGLGMYDCSFIELKDLYGVATGNVSGGLGMIFVTDGVTLDNVSLNLNNQGTQVGIKLTGVSEMWGGEIYGGSTTPTANAGSYGIDAGNYAVHIHGTKILYCRDHGIRVSTGLYCRDSIIRGCKGDGISMPNGSNGVAWLAVIGSTIHGNSGHGIFLDGSDAAATALIRNCMITGHTQTAKAGIKVTTSGSDLKTRGWGYNNVWNNTTNMDGVSAAPTDFSIDPDYADEANNDFTPQEATLKAAFPTSF